MFNFHHHHHLCNLPYDVGLNVSPSTKHLGTRKIFNTHIIVVSRTYLKSNQTHFVIFKVLYLWVISTNPIICLFLALRSNNIYMYCTKRWTLKIYVYTINYLLFGFNYYFLIIIFELCLYFKPIKRGKSQWHKGIAAYLLFMRI